MSGERRQWLGSYGPGVPGRLDYGSTTLVDQFDDVARRHASRPAMDFLGRTTTYATLADAVSRAAESLRRMGVGAGDRVALIMPNCPQHVIAFEAVVRLGAVVVEHNPLYTAAELRGPFLDHGARVAIAWDAVVPMVEELKAESALEHIVAIDLTRELPLRTRLMLRLPVAKARAARAQLTRPAPGTLAWHTLLRSPPLDDAHRRPTQSDTALLLYTSGTTGVPKGVPLTHRNLVANTVQGRAWVPGLVAGEETFLLALPLFHAYGATIGVLFGLSLGAKLVLLPKPDTELIMAALRREVPGFIPAVPPLYERIVTEAERRGVSIRGVRYSLSGAMPLPAELVARWEAATGGLLVEGYGLTETSPVIVGNPMTQARRPGSIGVPFPDVEVRLTDPEDLDREVAVGERGELLVRGPQVFAGYRDMPGETDLAFHDGWFRTGDIVTMSDDGFLTLVDRIKEIIITGGFNVYPSEVESVLRTHPAVADAAVVGDKQSSGSETVVAAVVLHEGQELDAEALQEHVRGVLTAYKVPRRIVVVAELPRNPLGKVLRREVATRVNPTGD